MKDEYINLKGNEINLFVTNCSELDSVISRAHLDSLAKKKFDVGIVIGTQQSDERLAVTKTPIFGIVKSEYYCLDIRHTSNGIPDEHEELDIKLSHCDSTIKESPSKLDICELNITQYISNNTVAIFRDNKYRFIFVDIVGVLLSGTNGDADIFFQWFEQKN